MLLAGFSLQDVSGAALNPSPLLVHIMLWVLVPCCGAQRCLLAPKSLISLSWPTAER